jgi:hypothetical protein
VTIIGFVGADPEQRQARNNNGSKFTVLSVATQRSWKNTDDGWASKTEWHGTASACSVRGSESHEATHLVGALWLGNAGSSNANRLLTFGMSCVPWVCRNRLNLRFLRYLRPCGINNVRVFNRHEGFDFHTPPPFCTYISFMFCKLRVYQFPCILHVSSARFGCAQGLYNIPGKCYCVNKS